MNKKLTPREIDILVLVSKGKGTKKIANQLCISVRTVETPRKNIKRKLGFTSFYSVISYAYENNILPKKTSRLASIINTKI